MSLGEINKGAVALILVLLFGAGGYLWFTQMYKPAVAARAAAQAEVSTAQASLDEVKLQLAAAQKRIEEAKVEGAKTDDSVARIAKARTAVPDKKLIDDAAIVLMDMADRSGVSTSFKSAVETTINPADTGALQGATPIDVEFKAAGSYAEMMQFMSLVEGTVDRKDDKLHTRGRLFNVVTLSIGEDEEESASTGFNAEGADEANDAGLIVGPNDIVFTVVVRMYTSTTANAEGVGAATPDDPAAAGTALDGTGASDGAVSDATAGADPSAGVGADTGAATDGGAVTDGGGAPTEIAPAGGGF